MKNSITLLNKCRICKSQKLFKFIDLGPMPIPNGFLEEKDLNKTESKYELSCLICENCELVQLSNIVNPDLMFKNYVYVPSVSMMMMDNFRDLSLQAYNDFGLNQDSLVVDIGSNDGSLLLFFKGHGTRVLGVDPAENLAKIAKMKGIPTEVKLFNSKNAKILKNKYGQADVITATNVVAHINDLHDFFEGVSDLLSKNGVLITEFPYLVELIRGNEFDTIYHEHLSYFALKPWLKLVESNDFEIIRLKKLSTHGGSIRLTHRRKAGKNKKTNSKIDFLIAQEESDFYNKKTLRGFATRVATLKIELLNLLNNLKKKGKRIVGYGAAAKGNILTNYFNIGPEILDYIVDSTPYKQGLFTPGKHIPVYAENRLTIDRPNYVLILAWNFADEIIEKEKDFRKNGGKFIIPIPKLKIV